MTKVIEVFVHNGGKEKDDVVTCNFLNGAMEYITPLVLSSICIAMIEKAIQSVPDESQIELEQTILSLFFYMLKNRYNIFEMDSESK